MEAIFHSLFVQLGVAAAIFPAIVKVFSTVEDSLSEQAKQKISSLTNKLGQAQIPSEPPKVSLVFEQVFGPRQVSFTCISRVAMLASISYLLVSLSVLTLEPEKYGTGALWRLTVLLVLINFPAEWVGLSATRAFVDRLEYSGDLVVRLPRWMKDRMHARWGNYEEWRRWDLILFLADCYWKLVWAGIFFNYAAVFKGLNEGHSWYDTPRDQGWLDPSILFRHEDPAAIVLAVSVLLSSLWIWIYVFLLRNLANVYKVVLALRWTLDFEKRPLKSLGVITAAICSVVYFCILLGTKLIVQS
jgi:hypothetical protein